MAVTGVTGQSRRSDLDTDQPLEYRYNQKMAKYARVAQESGFDFIPAIFFAYGSDSWNGHGVNEISDSIQIGTRRS